MSPFMRNVRKCGKFNGHWNDHAERSLIVNDIINTASSNVDQELIDRLNRMMIRAENRTLNMEHDALRAMTIR